MNWKFKDNKWVKSFITWQKIGFVAFFVWLAFFSENSCKRKLDYNTQIKELKSEIAANKDSTVFYDAKTKELDTDRETLEKIAREQYGMKRVDEDVYITDIP